MDPVMKFILSPISAPSQCKVAVRAYIHTIFMPFIAVHKIICRAVVGGIKNFSWGDSLGLCRRRELGTVAPRKATSWRRISCQGRTECGECQGKWCNWYTWGCWEHTCGVCDLLIPRQGGVETALNGRGCCTRRSHAWYVCESREWTTLSRG